VDDSFDRLFPRDFYGRIALALGSLTLGPVCWFLAIVLLLGGKPDGILGWLVLAVVEELFLALALFFTCGLIWSLATPQWLEPLLAGVAGRLGIALGLFAIPLCILAAVALAGG
jgi:hypothetical protein